MSKATFARIYSETTHQIERHMSRVKEGRDVDSAVSFGRWLFWSGIPELLKENSTAHDELGPLKCDGPHLIWCLNELLQACNEYYRTGRPSGLEKTDLDSIREKLDKLASNQDLMSGHLSKLISSPVPVSTDEAVAGTAPLPPGGAGGWGRQSPSLSKCHNCIDEIKVNRINGFEIPENGENAENGKGSYPHET